ncbi:MAG: hypothetical protein JXR86_20585 [Spirochaetales bacterium]|nr:hypothetical protein [Spirochaetales bacterium]
MYTLIYLAAGLALMILQYYMLCHLTTESTLLREYKRNWVLAFTLVPLISSVVYYFREYRRA